MNTERRPWPLIAGTAYVMVCVVAVPVVLLRLFGYLFFAGTTPSWAVVPALVLIALLPVAVKPFPGRRVVAIALGVAYFLSIFFYGWSDLQLRISEGQAGGFDALEASLILTLITLTFTRSSK